MKPPVPPLRASIGALIRAEAVGDGLVFREMPSGERPGAVELADRARLIDALEVQLTVYRDDSEVSRLNATAHTVLSRSRRNCVLISIRRAVEISRVTAGAYDVTSGATFRSLGIRPGPEADPRRRDPRPTPGPDRLAPPDARPRGPLRGFRSAWRDTQFRQHRQRPCD